MAVEVSLVIMVRASIDCTFWVDRVYLAAKILKTVGERSSQRYFLGLSSLQTRNSNHFSGERHAVASESTLIDGAKSTFWLDQSYTLQTPLHVARESLRKPLMWSGSIFVNKDIS